MPTAGGSAKVDFETAQRELFDAAGLDPTSRFLDGPSGRVHVLELGPREDGPPLVFVHGTAAFGAFLAPLMARLDGTRRIAFDRPGYGLSDPFLYTEANVRPTVVQTLQAVLDDADADPVDLVGHSMGGQAAILFALAHPERVRRLLLVGSVVGFPGTRPPAPIRLLTAPVVGRLIQRFQKSGEEGVLDIAEIFGERGAIRDHPAFIRAVAAHEADRDSSAAGLSEFRALVSILGWRSSIRIRVEDLRRIRPPTRVIWGSHDPLGVPADVRGGIESIPDVRFETVDAGHIPFLGHPERCARLVRA